MQKTLMRFSLHFFLALGISLLISACAHTSGDDFYKAARFEQAADLYMRAAEEGDLKKILRLAEMYASGKIDYRRDYQQAAYWYEKAARLGDVGAMYELGIIYEYGQGDVAQDLTQAIHWYRRAADNGHGYSQYRLGAVYAKRDVGADNIEAYKWFLIAEHTAAQCPGDRNSEAQCRIVRDDLFNYKWELLRHMNDGQMAKARQLAQQWWSPPEQ